MQNELTVKKTCFCVFIFSQVVLIYTLKNYWIMKTSNKFQGKIGGMNEYSIQNLS